MKNFLLAILLLFLCTQAVAEDSMYVSFYNSTVSKLAPDYRLPNDKDLKYEWKMKDGYPYKMKDYRGEYKAPFWTSGYFNNDDKVDFAFILIHKTKKEKQLFAFISDGPSYVKHSLGEPHTTEMGLATQKSGNLKTASGKGYWEPTPDDPPVINIKRNAISFFMFESASSVFVYDEKKKNFNRHWISD